MAAFTCEATSATSSPGLDAEPEPTLSSLDSEPLQAARPARTKAITSFMGRTLPEGTCQVEYLEIFTGYAEASRTRGRTLREASRAGGRPARPRGRSTWGSKEGPRRKPGDPLCRPG